MSESETEEKGWDGRSGDEGVRTEDKVKSVKKYWLWKHRESASVTNPFGTGTTWTRADDMRPVRDPTTLFIIKTERTSKRKNVVF